MNKRSGGGMGNVQVDSKPLSDAWRAGLMDVHSGFMEQAISDLILLMSRDGKLLYVSASSQSILGIDPHRLRGMNIHDLVDEDDHDRIKPALAAKESDGFVSCECRLKHANGNPLWSLLRSRRLENHDSYNMLLVISDINERRQLERQLEMLNRQVASMHDALDKQVSYNTRVKAELHALSAQLLSAQELERKRIANELHDGLGQRLSGIKFAVENVWRTTDSEIFPEHSQHLHAIIEAIRDSIEEVRRVSMDLRPSILDDLGLIATIGWFCREFNHLFPAIHVHRDIGASESDIPDEIKVVIFRIIQEAFHNIAKHAHADHIDLELGRHHNNTLHLAIRDNGRGISSIDCSPCAKGLGLKSMRERAEQSNGEFRIDSVSGQGTAISAQWRLLEE